MRAYFFLRSALTLTKKKNYRALTSYKDRGCSQMATLRVQRQDSLYLFSNILLLLLFGALHLGGHRTLPASILFTPFFWGVLFTLSVYFFSMMYTTKWIVALHGLGVHPSPVHPVITKGTLFSREGFCVSLQLSFFWWFGGGFF